MTVTGSCLCGEVRYEVTAPFLDISQCHCSLCRKISGTAGNATMIVPLAQFRWLAGQDRVREYKTDTRLASHFCTNCGSQVPGTHEEMQMAGVPAGGLDADPGVPVGVHIFVGSKAAWDVIGDDAPQYDESWI